MQHLLKTITASIALAAASLSAAPFAPETVPADATFYGHVNVTALRTSELGNGIMQGLDDTQRARLRFIERMFGFSPIDDLSGITLYGMPDEKEAGLLILQGRFDRTALLDLIQTSEQYKETKSGSHIVYEWYDEDKNRMTWGAFYGVDRVVVSDRKPLVEGALKTLDGDAPSLADNASALAADSSSDSALVVGVANLGQLEAKPDAAFLKQVEEAFLQVDETPQELSVHLAMEAETREQALNIQKVLNGLAAFIALNADERPLAAELAKRAVCTLKGKRVEVDMAVPTVLAVEFMQKRIAER